MSTTPQTLDLAALLAQAAAHKATGPQVSRSAKMRDAQGQPVYGVFVTPCGHIIAVDYTSQGRELQQWGTYRKAANGKLTRIATHRRKVDALDALDKARQATAPQAAPQATSDTASK